MKIIIIGIGFISLQSIEGKHIAFLDACNHSVSIDSIQELIVQKDIEKSNNDFLFITKKDLFLWEETKKLYVNLQDLRQEIRKIHTQKKFCFQKVIMPILQLAWTYG